jgi:hypothetical protein
MKNIRFARYLNLSRSAKMHSIEESEQLSEHTGTVESINVVWDSHTLYNNRSRQPDLIPVRDSQTLYTNTILHLT